MADVQEIVITAIVCFMGPVASASNTQTHFRADHTEMDTLKFGFDPTMNHLVAILTRTCFMVPLTHDEVDHIHSSSGLEQLEVKMMRDWIGKLPEIRVYHDDTNLRDNVKRWCATRDIYLLQRNVNAVTTQKSPLATSSS